jgi:uncharacterized protein YjaG (DUF416 family)
MTSPVHNHGHDDCRFATVMLMRAFDEKKLIRALTSLPNRQRTAFAAACAERQMASYRSFAMQQGRPFPDPIERTLAELWNDLVGERGSVVREEQLEGLIALIPQDVPQGEWTQVFNNAQNAGMATAYALGTRIRGDAQQAAWAARTADDALDNFVINSENIDTNEPGAEERVLTHPLVQAELARQDRDLSDLNDHADSAQVIANIRDRARAEATSFLS